MSAIITTKFRFQSAANLLNAIGGNGSQTPESYYIFIGRSMAWPIADASPTTPQDRLFDEIDAMQNILALKKITSTYVSHAVPRHNWVSGTTYYEYDDQDSVLYSKQFYVITDDLNCYKCIKAGAGASINKPTGTSPLLAVPGNDGYQWKFMFQLTGSDVNKFLTSTFLPVKKLSIDDASLQWPVQDGAIDGGIHRIKITSGGSGYQAKPTITISGNGTGCIINASDITLTNGVVTEIAVDPSNAGINYSQATVTIAGGNPTVSATARAVISPSGGHGSDPVRELGGYYVMIDTQLVADEGSGDFIVDNDFRQIGLIRNPVERTSGTIGAATTYTALTTLDYSNVQGAAFTKDLQVIGQSSSAIAIIDSVDNVNGLIRVHQNASTGFKSFTVGETIQVGTSTAILDTITLPEIVLNTGEVVYIENLSPVNRNISQTEDIKLVLEL